MDSILQTIRDTFARGIQAMPGYQFGDQVSMALGTKQELDNLPTIEREDTEE